MEPIHDPADAVQARYEALVLPHLDRLLSFARRRTATGADAEDAVQETCARAWVAFDQLRDDAHARPWLFRILISVLAADGLRAGRRRALVPITRLEAAHEALVGGEPDAVFLEVVARMTADAVQRALDALPEEMAAPLELHVIDGLKYREVAETLGIPLGTVMSRIHRARKLLEGALALETRAPAGAMVRRSDAPADVTAGAPSAAPAAAPHWS